MPLPAATMQTLQCTRGSGVLARPSASRASLAARPRLVQKRSVVVRAEDVAAPSAPAVTDDTFDELVLKSKLPVLVDFWAPWCGPCRMIAPLIDQLATDFEGKLVCYKLNTDESPGIAGEYNIRSIPTVMIFKGGQKMESIIGAVPIATLKQTVEKFL